MADISTLAVFLKGFLKDGLLLAFVKDSARVAMSGYTYFCIYTIGPFGW